MPLLLFQLPPDILLSHRNQPAINGAPRKAPEPPAGAPRTIRPIIWGNPLSDQRLRPAEDFPKNFELVSKI